MNYKEIEGNLVTLAKEDKFDIIAHGCNCQCVMKRGIAPQLAEAFGCDHYRLEGKDYIADPNKLGQIDYGSFYTEPGEDMIAYTMNKDNDRLKSAGWKKSYCVNCYTQYHWSSTQHPKPFDYEAFTLCMRKINMRFPGKHIGLPQIGAGLAGGDWNLIKHIIQTELKDMEITIVIFKP